jgi:Zn-dependent protease
MISYLFTNPLLFVVIMIGLVIAVTIHEFAHAWIADKLGDPTPRIQDRVTLDPRAHLDPLGTLALLFFRFGWGKPVQFDPYNLKEPIRDSAIIALAGPVSNIILASAMAVPIHLGLLPGLLEAAFIQIIFINIILAVFNLIPVYPLDGSKILMAILPQETAYEYEQLMNRYGILFLVFLILPWGGTSVVSQLISPIMNVFLNILLP